MIRYHKCDGFFRCKKRQKRIHDNTLKEIFRWIMMNNKEKQFPVNHINVNWGITSLFYYEFLAKETIFLVYLSHGM